MRSFAVSLLMLSLCACASAPRPVSSSSLTVVETDSLPAPELRDLSNQRGPALVAPGDVLAIDVFGVEELTREVQTDSSNHFTFPFVGEVDAGGRTPAEIAEVLRAKLAANYVRDPQVSVNIKNEKPAPGFYVTVDGQVEEPGLYPVGSNMTLMRAVASAKGLTDNAKLQDVVILRTVGNQRMAGLYNLNAIRAGAYADPTIYPNDVVVVGDSPSRRLFSTLIAVSPVLAAPLIAVLQR